MNFWNFYIFVSKIKSFGKNFILVPGFMVNPFVFLSVVGPVPVLQFTPENDPSSKNSETEKEYQFECAYCAFKSYSYMDFMEHINNNHLESGDEKQAENDDQDKNTKNWCPKIWDPCDPFYEWSASYN